MPITRTGEHSLIRQYGHHAMPLRPDFSQHHSDRRFDRYRDVVGRLIRGDTAVGYVLVTVQPYAEQVGGGPLWWRRWGPTNDVLWLWTVVDGQFSDSVLPADATDDELAAFDEGRYEYYGEALRVKWASPSESRRLASEEFGR